MALARTFEITGIERLQAVLQRLGPAALEAAARALFQEAEAIMTVSKTAFVPVKFGALRASGTVQPPTISGSDVSVVLGYGGGAVDYAVVVHERLGVFHPVGQPKYLEVPVLAAMQGMDARLAATLRRDLAAATGGA